MCVIGPRPLDQQIMAGAGVPFERLYVGGIKGMTPWQVGLMLMVPAAVDMYRYFVPRSVWAPWTSISGKTFLLGIGFTL